MPITVIENHAEKELLHLIEEINKAGNISWGILAVKRQLIIQPLATSFFIAEIKPALLDAAKAEVFFLESEIYIAWSGLTKQISEKLKTRLAGLLEAEVRSNMDEAVTFYDPHTMGEKLHFALKKFTKIDNFKPTSPSSENTAAKNPVFEYTLRQIEIYKKQRQQKRTGTKLLILVIEDQAFTRKLLSDVLRLDNTVNSAETAAQGWQLFIETAPDIVFLDIELGDASGHALAAKMKEIDPQAFIIMFTANNSMDDVQRAKQNKVSGFISKPFSKQKINEAIEKYRHTIGDER